MRESEQPEKWGEIFLNARKQVGMTREQVAEKMETSLSVIGWIESFTDESKRTPTVRLLHKYATALGGKLIIRFVPIK